MVRISFSAVSSLLILSASTSIFSLATTIGPIDNESYRELTNGEGFTGSCRGPGGGDDRVDSKNKIVDNQEECEDACDAEGNECVAYAYQTSSKECTLFGETMDGHCDHQDNDDADFKDLHLGGGIRRFHSENACGICKSSSRIYEKSLNELTCGRCTEEVEQEFYGPTGCSNAGGDWSSKTWEKGVWTKPEDPWLGDSQTHFSSFSSTSVHSITVVDDWHCIDKLHADGQPTCTNCQKEFENTYFKEENCPNGCTFYVENGNHPPYCDGTPDNKDENCITTFESRAMTEENCDALSPTDCVFKPAPVFVKGDYSHFPPIDLGPGWQPEVLKATENSGLCGTSQVGNCKNDAENISGYAFGVCRIDKPAYPNGEVNNYKWCANCLNSNGDNVNKDEAACAQACLDDPSGACVAMSHALGANCLIYGPNTDNYLQGVGDDPKFFWGTNNHKTQPCVGPNVPFGCENINTIKPNERFICRHMNTDSTRWEAWGEAKGVAEIHVNIMLQQIENSADKKIKSSSITDEMKSGLESRIAEIVFLDPNDVSVKIDKKIHRGRLLEFTITTSETIVAPVTGLLKTLLVASTGDVYHYLNAIDKIGNGYGKNFGNLIPFGTKVYGVEVVGMKRNLKTWKKERAVYSWNNALSACGDDPNAKISGTKTCKDLANKSKKAINKKCEDDKFMNACPDTCALKCGEFGVFEY